MRRWPWIAAAGAIGLAAGGWYLAPSLGLVPPQRVQVVLVQCHRHAPVDFANYEAQERKREEDSKAYVFAVQTPAECAAAGGRDGHYTVSPKNGSDQCVEGDWVCLAP